MSKQIKVTLSKEELLKKDCLSTVNGAISYNSVSLSLVEKESYTSFESMVKWHAEDNIRLLTILECLKSIKLSIEESDDVDTCLKKLFAGIFSTAKSSTSNSTSVFSNAITSAKLKGYFEVLDTLLRMQNYEY